MSLNVSTFEGNIDLTTIPVNRQWVIPAPTPTPFYIVGSNKNVAVKKIEVGVTYNALSPDDNITLLDWGVDLVPCQFDQSTITGIVGTVTNPTSGIFTIVNSSLRIHMNYSKNCPIIDFGDDYILIGGLQQDSVYLVFSNTTTTLGTVVRYYINIFWEELCQG